MSHQAYKSAQRITEDPRNTEYRLFGQVTGALIDAQQKGIKGGPLAEAVDWNRRLWGTLAADCMDDRNRLPKEVRAQIVSLSLWVTRYSKQVTRTGASMDPLIEVNRTIMQGLSGAA
ncbi:MAG: flagellar biosynthesis regulator FlaF [Alphaproteobacteria bacterium]|nr:flagellar biosynthesis regulator FlaF [Alphaproteobacteria bacterium]MBU6471427.1 flagellar biosynthesis regulator FlaF [Alphaproteobacteria bacterium]MDE2012881.1 flagellar biosynthesis regulator FlaF [Alphaproteobacteria bacterium]MDE2073411.1 flagellar biosynthesis regulator FlaF [Alphaproteobacteria bacterium]MDE2350706.1 flagellar biosynthesis regulator FlaF [Alphaproteobacteria bacterium]